MFVAGLSARWTVRQRKSIFFARGDVKRVTSIVIRNTGFSRTIFCKALHEKKTATFDVRDTLSVRASGYRTLVVVKWPTGHPNRWLNDHKREFFHTENA